MSLNSAIRSASNPVMGSLVIVLTFLGIAIQEPGYGEERSSPTASGITKAAYHIFQFPDSVVKGQQDMQWSTALSEVGPDPILVDFGISGGDAAWLSCSDSLKIHYRGGKLPADSFALYRVCVFSDSSTGSMLRAELTRIDSDQQQQFRQFDKGQLATFTKVGLEQISGLADVTPGVGLYEAIFGRRWEAFLATQIYAHYVQYSREDAEARAVWIIDLYGIPSMSIHSGFSTFSVYHWVVDATSGETLFGYLIPIMDEDHDD